MTNFPTLYSLSLTGEILTWTITVIGNKIQIETGSYKGATRTIERLVLKAPKHKLVEEQAVNQASRKYLDKINKDGYVHLNHKANLEQELAKLSINKVDANNRLKPQKAFKGFPVKFPYPCIGQPKINGLRGVLRWETTTTGDGMFTQSKAGAVIRSMNGLQYVMPHITDSISRDFFGESGDLVYDGELYSPNLTLNKIRSSVPTELASGTTTKPSGVPEDIGFVIFDLSMPDIIQMDRIVLAKKMIKKFNYPFYSHGKHSVSDVNMLANAIINSKTMAEEFRDQCIDYGFEGAILRVIDAEYAFGSRSAKIMAKLKKFQDTECKVLDIYLKNEDSVRTYIQFILKNDINDSTFEATPMGDEDQRQEYLNNKDKYIGEYATVKFYERSGVQKLPYHGNVVSIRNQTADM